MLNHSVIEQILPLKSPFLMVDMVSSYQNNPFPKIRTQRMISSLEPFFASDSILNELPSVYIIEGLAQSSILLSILLSYEKSNPDVRMGDNSLLNYVSSNLDDINANRLVGEVEKTLDSAGLLAEVDVEIFGKVFQGDILMFEVEQMKVYADISRYRVKAFVGENEVANGFLTGSKRNRM